MDCFEKTIFHLNRTTDDNYPECQVTKTSIRRDLNSALTTIFEYNLLRKELSEKEKKVFSKWSKNAKETKLPLITYMEALKISVDMDKKN